MSKLLNLTDDSDLYVLICKERSSDNRPTENIEYYSSMVWTQRINAVKAARERNELECTRGGKQRFWTVGRMYFAMEE
jgi:hypothetical protein